MPCVRRCHPLPPPLTTLKSVLGFSGVVAVGPPLLALCSLGLFKNFDFSLLQTDMFVGKGGGFEVGIQGLGFGFLS